MDVTTRIEEESRIQKVKEPELPTLSDAESTDDELEGLETFSVARARSDLYNLPGCYQISIETKYQKLLGIEVGINVSQEFPWKRVKFKLMAENHFFDHIENGEEIQEFFVKYKSEDMVLLGYAPSLVKQEDSVVGEDPFVIYISERAAREAAAIIRNVELYERFMMNKNLVKRPREWLSKGSEDEVNLGIPRKKSDVVDVEIQGVYPMKQSRIKFRQRLCADVRDGYAEIIAGEAKFQNVTQQRVHVGVQSAPATVELEQQTDPTFPSNAWAQYLYEIKDDADGGLDETSEEEQEKGKSTATSKTVTPVQGAPKPVKPKPEMSEQLKHLLSTLEFNQIDMYRNDYPLISPAPIQRYTNPYLEEIFCFANISKSNNRYVSSVDWYPSLTGIVVAAYSFTTKVTFNSVTTKERVDLVQRTILEPNPILMWSFMDSLNYKLEFEAHREITCLSFCPYDENVLIGGTINGQIIIWDLQDRGKNLEAQEHLTIVQLTNRELIAEFLSWTIQYDEGTWVVPAAVSALDCSQTDAITEIKWLSRYYYVSSNGRIHGNHTKHKSRYFCTLCIDGSVAYWTLDYDIGKTAKAAAKKNLPAALTQSESVYKKMDKLIKPVFMVTYPEPLTTLICDMANYKYTPMVEDTGPVDTGVKTFPIKVEEADQKLLRNYFIVGSFFGRIEHIAFEGCDSDTGAVVKEQVTTPMHSFARVHDGPIVGLEKNPFYPEIFASVGRFIFAIWKEDFPFTPILWRVRPKILTSVKWSTDRPAVLFLTRIDGSFEAWDLLARDDDACLIEVLGGGVLTVISEHRAKVPRKVISIGDYNSSFRMVALPEGFYTPVPNELERLQTYVEKEVFRKKSIQSWQQNWREQNADIIEEKKKAEAEAARDLERLRAEAEEAKHPKEVPQEQKQEPVVSGARYDLPERLDKKWDELNLRRLMHNLMARKKVDPEKLDRETALEKERLRYEERKRISIQEAISRVSADIAAVRARLLPVEKPDVQLSDMIAASVEKIFEISPTYDDVADEAKEFLETAPEIPPVSFKDVLQRCRERRLNLNQLLGVPYDRQHYCELQRGLEDFQGWDLGYDEFMKTSEEFYADKISENESTNRTIYSDLDNIPVKDVGSEDQ